MMTNPESVDTVRERERERELQFRKIKEGGNTFINHIKKDRCLSYVNL